MLSVMRTLSDLSCVGTWAQFSHKCLVFYSMCPHREHNVLSVTDNMDYAHLIHKCNTNTHAHIHALLRQSISDMCLHNRRHYIEQAEREQNITFEPQLGCPSPPHLLSTSQTERITNGIYILYANDRRRRRYAYALKLGGQ